METIGVAVSSILDWYGEQPQSITSARWCPSGLDMEQSDGGFREIKCVNLPCSTDPGRYLSAPVYSITQLVTQFQLNYVETLSVAAAWSKWAYRPSYFVVAVQYLLGAPSPDVYNKSAHGLPRRGPELGQFIIGMMRAIRVDSDHTLRTYTGKKMNPGAGFRYQGVGIQPDKTPPRFIEFRDQMYKLAKICLQLQKVGGHHHSGIWT